MGESWAPTSSPLSCPPAGSASRRCLLSAQGVAYWGLPSFARCISHEYRYLYLSVSAPCWAGGTQGLPQTLVGEGGSLILAHAHVPWPIDACPLLPNSASPCLANSYSSLNAGLSSFSPGAYLSAPAAPLSFSIIRCCMLITVSVSCESVSSLRAGTKLKLFLGPQCPTQGSPWGKNVVCEAGLCVLVCLELVLCLCLELVFERKRAQRISAWVDSFPLGRSLNCVYHLLYVHLSSLLLLLLLFQSFFF